MLDNANEFIGATQRYGGRHFDDYRAMGQHIYVAQHGYPVQILFSSADSMLFTLLELMMYKADTMNRIKAEQDRRIREQLERRYPNLIKRLPKEL